MLAVSDHPNLSLPGTSVARAGEDKRGSHLPAAASQLA
jgi:hypothetical protein